MGSTPKKQEPSWNKMFLWEVCRAVAIMALPFCIYLHLCYSIIDTEGLFIFNVHWRHGYENNQVFIWYLLKDFIPSLLLLIWYYSSTHWWKHFILPILSLFVFSLLQGLGVVQHGTLPELGKWDLLYILGIGLFLMLVAFYIKTKSKGNDNIIFDMSSNYRGSSKAFFKNYKAYYETIKSKRRKGAFEAHLKKLYSLEANLQDWIGRTTGMSEVRPPFNKRILEVVVIFILLFLPLLRYAVESIPSGQNSLRLLWFTIESEGFEDVLALLWFLCLKIMILIPLCIWYVTCRNWWKYAILSPIILYAFQIWEAFQDNKALDAYGNIRAFPAVFVVVVMVVSLSIVVQYRSKILDLHQDIKIEIEALLGKMEGSNHTLARQQKIFKELQDTKVVAENTQNHLQSLLKLREELLRELDQKN